MDCVRVASKHGEGGAAQHTHAWQYMQQSCRTRVCSLCSGVPVLLARNCIVWRSGRIHHTERSLQVNGSHHIRITHLVIHRARHTSKPVGSLRDGQPHVPSQADTSRGNRCSAPHTHTPRVERRPSNPSGDARPCGVDAGARRVSSQRAQPLPGGRPGGCSHGRGQRGGSNTSGRACRLVTAYSQIFFLQQLVEQQAVDVQA